MKVKDIKGVKDSSLILKLFVEQLELLRAFKVENKESFFYLCITSNLWGEDDYKKLLTFVLDDQEVAFSQHQFDLISPKVFLKAIKMICEYIFELELDDVVKGELNPLTYKKVNEVRKEIERWNSSLDVKINDFLLEVLRK